MIAAGDGAFREGYRMARLIGLLLLSMQAGFAVAATPAGQFVDRVYSDDAGDHRYVVFVPQNPSDEPLPVVLFLHGAGEKGVDGRRQLTVGLGPALEAWPDYPAYVVFPQCEDLNGRHLLGWRADRADAKRALRILDQVIADYPIDSRRQALCGWSMGGYGAWSVAAAYPERWQSVLAFSGGGDPEILQGWPAMASPVWAIHGESDSLVPVQESEQMMQALLAAGGTGRLDQLPGIGHDVWRWGL
ncbi:MAG: dienelactone hydrolase family protein, partial [Planctomycetaceae bacterium]|nr:dienelactone hydrolase family protein [Planctomycetaceae bacterium]